MSPANGAKGARAAKGAKGANGANGTKAANGADAARKRARRGRGKGPAPGTAKTSGDFWGSADKLPPVREVTVSSDPSAVVRSLGRPPFSGHEAVSEYYLRAVYDNTVKLAEVLATAGDLLEGPADNKR